MEYQGFTSFAGAVHALRFFDGRSARRAILTVVAAVSALSTCAWSQGTDGLIIIQGTPQTGATTRSLPVLFSVQTKANQTSGIPITFAVNANGGAGGTFPGSVTSFIVKTDPNGYAVPPLLVANNTAGNFTVTASDPTGGSVVFNLTTNQCVGTPPGVVTPQVTSTSGDPTVAGSLPYEVANACAGSTITFANGVTGIIQVKDRMRIDNDLTILGPGATTLAVDGGNSTRLFYVGGGIVNITGLTLQNGLGGGGSHSCGGGAAGMGGALFVHNGSVVLSSVALINNRAQGSGISTSLVARGTGGAGFGGAPPTGANGNGIGGVGGSGGDLGGFGGFPALVSGNTSTAGGEGAGGGGYTTPNGVALPASGGAGGFGGGGGAGIGPNNKAGIGGFGGGGGAGLSSAFNSVGVPGPSAANAAGGWGGGNGALTDVGTLAQPNIKPIGGGGAGFGGAVFLMNGSLTLQGVTLTNNSAVGGAGGTSGQGKGGALFIVDNATSSTLDGNVAVDFGSIFSGNTAAEAGIGGIGSTDPAFVNYILGHPCPGADTADICGFLYEGTLQATAGVTQTVTVGGNLSTLQATVQLPSNVPSTFLANVPVTFTTPATGASATFAGGATTATVPTDGSGVAAAPPLVANNTSGSYNINANIGSLQAQFAITNNAQSQTITFNAIPTQTQGTNLILTATASSGLAVSFTSLTPVVCSVSGTTANLLTPGMCTIQASQAGDATHAAATPVSQSFTVLGTQTITFNPIPAQTQGTSITLQATASSGLAVSFTSLTPVVCGVSGTTANLLTAGMCTIQASQAGDTTHAAATPVSQSFTVLGTQTITFNPIPAQTQGTSITLKATASSGLPVSFTSSTPLVCTVSGTTASLIAGGTCTVQASQVGNAAFAAATPVSQSFTVQSAAAFTITPNPPSETLKRGNVAAFILQLKSVSGFNGNVKLSCSGGPTGSSCANFPMTVHLNGTAYAISGIFFPKTTAPGTYTITFTGASGALTNTATAKFTVQ